MSESANKGETPPPQQVDASSGAQPAPAPGPAPTNTGPDGKDKKPWWRRWGLPWLFGAICGGLFSTIFDVNVGEHIKAWLTGRDPLDIIVSTALPTRAPNIWKLVVEDTNQLPNLGPRPLFPPGADCEKLWEAGKQAHGVYPDFARYEVVLHGKATSGVSIANLRAIITERAPAANGALMSCKAPAPAPPGPPSHPFGTDVSGPATATGFYFDLGRSNSDEALGTNLDTSNHAGSDSNQFSGGFRINVALNETVIIEVKTLLPRDAVHWRIQADADVDGKRKAIDITDGGSDFHSPGQLDDDKYKLVYRGGSDPGNWPTT